MPIRTVRRSRRALTVLASLMVFSTCLGPRHEPLVTLTETPGTSEHGIQVGDLTRTFLLHVPPSRPRRFGLATAYPLVIVLHGSGASGQTVRRMSRMDSIADAGRFLVAYPNATTGAFGLGADWNAGECCGAAKHGNVNDVGFISSLVSVLAAELPVNRRRVYVAGFSDGGRMAYRVACDLSERVAAIAVVSGSLETGACAPRRPVPLIAFHGTADDEVPYSDSSSSSAAAKAPAGAGGAPPSVQFWATINECQSAVTRQVSPHVLLTRFQRCAANVLLYTIEGGGHAWPGGVADGDEPTHELSASGEAWRFFGAHRLP